MFLSLDGTLWVQLINFAIFFAVLNYVFLRPVGAAIAKRRRYIDSLTADYDAAQKQAADLRNQAEGVRAEARRAAEHTISRKRAEASDAAAAISADYHARAQAEVERAQRQAAGELEVARQDESLLAAQLAAVLLTKTLPKGGAS
ncbi:MAG TPA: ATP synthase F0 subunit B [Verrucomicrobiae bacterium]|nr:ATP synthase F0 subunit B [Verrucomicrobiae bacterium]